MKKIAAFLMIFSASLALAVDREYIANIIDPAFYDFNTGVINDNFEDLFKSLNIPDNQRYPIVEIEDVDMAFYNAIAINRNFETAKLAANDPSDFDYTVEDILDADKSDRNTFYVNSGFEYFWNILEKEGGDDNAGMGE